MLLLQSQVWHFCDGQRGPRGRREHCPLSEAGMRPRLRNALEHVLTSKQILKYQLSQEETKGADVLHQARVILPSQRSSLDLFMLFSSTDTKCFFRQLRLIISYGEGLEYKLGISANFCRVPLLLELQISYFRYSKKEKIVLIMKKKIIKPLYLKIHCHLTGHSPADD